MSGFDDDKMNRERLVDSSRPLPTTVSASGRSRHSGKIVLGVAVVVIVGLFVLLLATDDGSSDDVGLDPESTSRLALAS